jgi:hypothetical protein
MQEHGLPKALMQRLLQPLVQEMLPIVGNDQDAAWESAEAATMCFNPGNVLEFRLALRIALFNIQANRFTAEASTPSLTPACAIRVARCGLSYAKEADKAESRLEKLQAARREEQTQPPEAALPQPEPAITPAQDIVPQASIAPAATTPAAPIPAYKRLKQERRLAKQRDKDARLQARAARSGGNQSPGLPLAA